jgi:hypothetical protein
MKSLRGTNNPSDETIRNSYLFSSAQLPSPDIDITIIAGDAREPSVELPLLLMRFHNLGEKAGKFGTKFFEAAKNGVDGITCGKDFGK